MALAIDILALILVIAFVWIAMVWFSGWFHRRRPSHDMDGGVVLDEDWERPSDDPCKRCDGVGARLTRGDLRPCERCEGTGVDPALH